MPAPEGRREWRYALFMPAAMQPCVTGFPFLRAADHKDIVLPTASCGQRDLNPSSSLECWLFAVLKTMSHPMFWDSSPDWDFLTNHEIMGPWLFGPTALPDPATNPTIADALEADALELETLLKLQEAQLELRKTREKEIGLLRRLFQIRAGRHATQIVPPDADSNRNPVFDPSQELLPSFAQQIILPGAENVVTNSSLLPLHSGDSGEATLFGSFVELPSNLSDSTLETADDLNFAHYSHEPTSDDQGIRSDGNYSLTSTLTFPPVTDNEGESSTNVFLVNPAETAADRIDAPSSESQTTQAVPVPSAESVIVRPKRRRSVLDLPWVDCFPSNEKASNFPREKRPYTDEERENMKVVKKLGGACLSCRVGKRQVGYVFVMTTACAEK